jgi:hypothetical protein
MKRVVGVAICVGFVLPSCFAEGQEDSIEFLSAAPQSPAFTFLGTTPTKVTRPGSIRDLGAALTNGIDADGKAVQGVAVESSPWALIPGFAQREHALPRESVVPRSRKVTEKKKPPRRA